MEIKKEEMFRTTPNKLFTLLTDYENYPKLTPEIKQVKVERIAPNVVLLKEKFAFLIEIQLITRIYEYPHNKIIWELENSNVFQTNSGSWELKELEENFTNLIYQVKFSLKIAFPDFIIRNVLEENNRTLMKRIKNRIEDLE